MSYIQCENTIQLHLFLWGILGHVIFWGGEILGPEEYLIGRKLALAVCLVAVKTLSPWHNFTITY